MKLIQHKHDSIIRFVSFKSNDKNNCVREYYVIILKLSNNTEYIQDLFCFDRIKLLMLYFDNGCLNSIQLVDLGRFLTNKDRK